MKTLKFTPTGKAISDFEITKFVDEMLASEETEFNISTNLVIDEIRARIAEGTIGIDDLRILVQGNDGEEKTFTVDRDGRSHDWVRSQDVGEIIISRMFCAQRDKIDTLTKNSINKSSL